MEAFCHDLWNYSAGKVSGKLNFIYLGKKIRKRWKMKKKSRNKTWKFCTMIFNSNIIIATAFTQVPSEYDIKAVSNAINFFPARIF